MLTFCDLKRRNSYIELHLEFFLIFPNCQFPETKTVDFAQHIRLILVFLINKFYTVPKTFGHISLLPLISPVLHQDHYEDFENDKDVRYTL